MDSRGDRKRSDAPRAFFGRRKGHPLRPRQAALFDTLLPKLAIDVASPAPARLRYLFSPAVERIELEIGFGGGEHLIARARANPGAGFIGSDPFVNAMGKALAAIEDARLENVRLHFGDAAQLLGWLPANSLARIHLLYPDPWPKRRHWKRRFVQDESLKALARILRPGGELRFATDIADYAAWTLARVLRSDEFSWTAEQSSDWRKPWPDFAGTRYQAKATREGRVPTYLEFRKS